MTRRVCTFGHEDSKGHSLFHCVLDPDHEGTVHRDAFGAEVDTAEPEQDDSGGSRRAIQEWEPYDGALPQSPKAVLKRMLALGLVVDVRRSRIEVDASYYAADGKGKSDHKKGDLKKPYHQIVAYALLARGAEGAPPLRIAAFWDAEQKQKPTTKFGDARWIVDGEQGWTDGVAGELTALLDSMEEAA